MQGRGLHANRKGKREWHDPVWDEACRVYDTQEDVDDVPEECDNLDFLELPESFQEQVNTRLVFGAAGTLGNNMAARFRLDATVAANITKQRRRKQAKELHIKGAVRFVEMK